MTLFHSARCLGRWSLLAGIFCLTACVQRYPEPPAVADQGIPPKLIVVAHDLHRVIFVNPKTGLISNYSRPGFDNFLATISPDDQAAIHLQLRGPLSPAALGAVVDVAVADGVGRPKISVVPAPPVHVKRGYDVAVQVEAVVYTVDQPTCPRTSHTTIGDYQNTPASDYGCATLSNFAAMVDDPRDLVRGETAGTTNSDVTVLPIEKEETDTVKPFLNDDSFSVGGGN